jgi:Hypothetical glycosyl hydrolase 6/Beta-galactosidase trimerisation domain
MLDTLKTGFATDTVKNWWQSPYRMIQTNLRQPDARVDQKMLARQVKEFGANVLLYNIGGIYAFYPTRLPLQAVNPMMQGDALGDAIEAAHSEGLALVGRFDMSKATRIAYEAHPEWFVHNARGEPLEYNGTYQACINGGWYNDYAFQIISEALGQYDLDGVFFNMFGYLNFTYSGDYFGIGLSDAGRKRFRDHYGHDLPKKEDFSDPHFRDWLDFKHWTALELRQRIYDHIKQVNPKVAVTGHRGASDLIRLETQRAVHRPQPEWPYQAGDQAKWGRAYGKGRTVSSTSANFIDFAWRFTSETGGLQELRAAQQLANGATLDYYLLGVMDQPDRKAFKQLSALFNWHRDHQDAYAGLERAAKVAIYHSNRFSTYMGATASGELGQLPFRGAYRALSEARIPFDFVVDASIEGDLRLEDLTPYDAIVLPNTSCLSDEEAAVLDSFVEQGGTLLATGETGFYDGVGRPRDNVALRSMPIVGMPHRRVDMKGAYFRVGKGDPAAENVDLVMLDGSYYVAEAKQDATTCFTLLPPQRFGPPELCFPDVESTLPGVLTARYGKGTAIYLPWHPDWQYFRDSLPDHRKIIADLVTRHTPPPPVQVVGRGALELGILRQPDTGKLLVHVVNYGGQRNNLYEDPAPVHGLRLGVRGAKGTALALRGGVEMVPTAPDDEGYVWYDLPPVETFEAVAVSAKG